MENEILFSVALLLISGILCGRFTKLFKLPNVTGYLIAGLLLGPSVLNIISADMVVNFNIISDIALGFIAFSIGSEFSLKYFKRVGLAPLIIATAESLGAIVLVTGVLLLLRFDLKMSIMLGAIAAATAPAQTIAVINQYKSKGSLTSMLMSVVAIDDATALIGFGFATTIVNMMDSNKKFNPVISLLTPLYEVVISFVLGGVICLIMTLLFRWFKKSSNRLCIIISMIIFTYWAAVMLHGSPLLACMALGGVLVNIYNNIDDIVRVSEAFNPPILMLFFVISGAGFQISALKGIGITGIVYVVFRVIGKWSGAWFGGKITKQEAKINKYLGPTLMPQAGVALGLVAAAGRLVPDYASQIQVIILCSTFIYSIVGPATAKAALVKAGEIKLS